MKEIDWEERHFRICLAILSCPVFNRHGHTDAPMLNDVVTRANKMIELLKGNATKMQKPDNCLENPPAADSEKDIIEADHLAKRCVPKNPIGRSAIKRTKLFNEIWAKLNELGYTQGSDIPYFHFNECCEDLNIDADSVDINNFCECYDVNIG